MKVRSIDVGYGNVKFCHGETDEQLECGHFPSIAKAHTGVDRGASVMTKRDLIEVQSGESKFLVGRDSIDTLSARDDRGGHLQIILIHLNISLFSEGLLDILEMTVLIYWYLVYQLIISPKTKIA